MMTFLFGKSGSGKTHRIMEEIGERLLAGESVILLCPEQEAVIAERRMTQRFGGRIPTARLEILNFGRLPERVFRVYGGLTAEELSDGGRRLLMHRAMTESAPFLREYSRCLEDEAMIDRLLAAVAEFKMFCVRPGDLESAADALSPEYARLHDKLADLTLLYAVYEELLHREYRDPQDALDALDGVLDETDGAFFAGYHVYLDGFNGFTAQQYRLIAHMLRHAASVTAALGCPPDDESEWMLRKIYETKKNLFRLARDEGTEVRVLSLTENKRCASPALRHLTEHLWRMDGKHTDAPFVGDDLAVWACDTPFEEADAVAREICRYVAGGGRYRDITIITRDIARYEGILDATLERYGIPCYTSRRTGVMTKPFFRYLRHLFSLAIYGFSRNDIIGLIKTGCTSLDRYDAFLYENYITTWNLSGRRLTEDEDWNMHPGGYIEQVTDTDIDTLARVNAIRRAVCAQYVPFCEDLRGQKGSIRDMAARLWQFLSDSGIPALLDERATEERTRGELSTADETEQLWEIFVSALDTLVMIAGDTRAAAADFWALFSLVLTDLDIGTIPARLDEVVIGDAALIRPDNARLVFLIGASDGAFPRTPEEDALLSDYEKGILSDLGVPLSADTAAQLQDEMFNFWFAAAAAEERLIITYPRADLSGKAYRPSTAVTRILALFAELREVNPGAVPAWEKLSTPQTAFDLMAYDKTAPLGRALREYYENRAPEDAAIRRRLDALSQPLTIHRNRLTEQTLTELFGDTIAMTHSRLESYVLCHFSYFCGYVLKLKEQKRAEFGTADIGSFVHDVLRGFMELYANDENPARFSDDAILGEVLDGLVSQYLENLCGYRGVASQPMRVRHLFSRLRTSSTVLARNLMHEFENSDFRPRDFELPVGGDDGRSIPALSIRAEDGTRIRLYGTIDRVDTYEKDGVTYVRVVDYKTFVKRFSLDDVAAGINMQMLLYLFSVWKNGHTRYGGELRPAGILYMAANPAETTHTGIPTQEEALSAAESGMTRSGLFLDDVQVLNAMEHGLGGKYIPVRMKKDGTYYKGASVETLERFGSLMREVEETVCAITMEMKHGNADAVPISKTNPDTGRDPCAYCKMRMVCRV